MVTADGLIARSPEDEAPGIDRKEAPAWLLRSQQRATRCTWWQKAARPRRCRCTPFPETDNPLDGAPLVKVSALREGKPLAAVFSRPGRRRPAARPAGEGDAGNALS